MRSAIYLLAVASLAMPASARAEAKRCTNGAVVFGDPIYSGHDHPNPSGAGLRDGPPIEWRTLAFVGANVFTATGDELWMADLASGKLHRVAGAHNDDASPMLSAGPCDKARLANVHGIAALPDGSLVAADTAAHAMIEITDPGGPGCKVSYLAGTTKPVDLGNRPRGGDEDGAGAKAQLGRPEWPVVDAKGDVYFVDSRSAKVKKLYHDAEHTVATLAVLPGHKENYGYKGMTLLGGKLYIVSNTFTSPLIYEVDASSGKIRDVLRKGVSFPGLDAGQAASLSSITNDGSALLVTGRGYIWRVTTSGRVTHIAGAGSPIEFPHGYNPKAGHAAKKLLLRYRTGDTSGGTNTSLSWHNGALYWRGRTDEGTYVVKIACQ